jgi:hypothetical protein
MYTLMVHLFGTSFEDATNYSVWRPVIGWYKTMSWKKMLIGRECPALELYQGLLIEGQRKNMKMSVIFWTISSHMREWTVSGVYVYDWGVRVVRDGRTHVQVLVLRKITTNNTKNTLCWRIICCLLGAFAKLRKATVSFAMSVRPSVRPSTRMQQLGSHWKDCHEM